MTNATPRKGIASAVASPHDQASSSVGESRGLGSTARAKAGQPSKLHAAQAPARAAGDTAALNVRQPSPQRPPRTTRDDPVRAGHSAGERQTARHPMQRLYDLRPPV